MAEVLSQDSGIEPVPQSTPSQGGSKSPGMSMQVNESLLSIIDKSMWCKQDKKGAQSLTRNTASQMILPFS